MSLRVQPAPRIATAPTAKSSNKTGSGQRCEASAIPHQPGNNKQPGSDRPVEPGQAGIRPDRRGQVTLDPVVLMDVAGIGGGSTATRPSPLAAPGPLSRMWERAGRHAAREGVERVASRFFHRHRVILTTLRLHSSDEGMTERRAPRLYVTAGLASGGEIELEPGQAHYLRSVLRLAPGAAVAAFNAADGEWLCRVAELGKSAARLTVERQLRPRARRRPIFG